MRRKVYDAAAIEHLAVWSEPAMVVVADIAAADLVGGLGEVIAGNERIRMGISHSMKVGFDAVVTEDVIVGVEREATDVVRYVIGVSPAEAGADLKVRGAARRGRGLTLGGEGSEEGKGDKNGEIG